MPTHFSEPVPGGSVSGTRAVERQAEGLIVEYALESGSREAVTVRLLDRLPADAAEVGFHEAHEPADWRVADGELSVTVTLEAGAERTYVLGMAASNGEELSCDAAAPDLEVVDADSSTGDGAEFFDGAGRSHLEGDDPGGDGREGDTIDSDAGDAATAPGPDEDGDAHQTVEDFEPDGETTDAGRKRVDADGGTVNLGPESGGVASALIAELESGTVTEPQRAKLEEHLGVGRSGPESVRLEYVQKRLADFDAYVDALEDLLSVHGSGDDAITEFDERLERLEGVVDDVEAIRRRQDEMAERLDGLSEAVDAQAETIESLRAAHDEDVDGVRTEIRRRAEAMSEEFDDLQRSLDADLDALEAEIEAFESIRRTLVDGLQRPDDTAPGTTVEDATPDAEDGSGAELPVVDATPDAEDGSGAELPVVDATLEESLEAAEASNFSVQASREADEAQAPDSDEESEQQRSGDEFVTPDPASIEDGWTDASDADPSGDDADPDADDTGIDLEDAAADDGTVSKVDETVPAVDELEGDPAAQRVDEGAIGDSDADVELERAEEGNDDGTDEVDGEPDDDGRRASSIFEIGDVDTETSGGEEKPTIDFEDS